VDGFFTLAELVADGNFTVGGFEGDAERGTRGPGSGWLTQAELLPGHHDKDQQQDRCLGQSSSVRGSPLCILAGCQTIEWGWARKATESGAAFPRPSPCAYASEPPNFLMMPLRTSMGSGKMMVEFFPSAISVRV